LLFLFSLGVVSNCIPGVELNQCIDGVYTSQDGKYCYCTTDLCNTDTSL